jgi:glycosyltransferase involved in cell wall biosynthesis
MLVFNPVGKGTYWRALHLARSLAKRGHDLTVLATPRQRRLRFASRADAQAGVTLVEAPDLLGGPWRLGWDPGNVVMRLTWVRKRQFDVVHAFESRPTVIFPALYGQRRGARLILDWCDWFGRGGSVEERPNRLMRSLLRPVETFFEERFRARADGATVINSLLQQRTMALGVAPEKILPLPNGSNVDEVRPIPQAEARRALGWPQDAPIVGYIGAIFPRDAVLMAQAFDKIRQAEPAAQLLLAGYCQIAVETLVKEPGAVRRTGPIAYDKINCYLSACDVCWLPLRDSGANRGRYPLKINDYMAVGKPVVATDVGDVADLIRRGKFGLLAPDRPDEVARQVVALLRNPAQREIMGRRARRLAESELTWDEIGGRLERFYQQILEGMWL